jgi:hypothetical protein
MLVDGLESGQMKVVFQDADITLKGIRFVKHEITVLERALNPSRPGNDNAPGP